MTHPDSDVLAEFHAGLITGRSGARISAHLAACERCTELSGQLAEISALLAAVPAPAMPSAVAQRLDSVLAAEAVQRDSSERAVGDSPPDRASSPRPRKHWDFRLVTLRVLAPAAAVVVLAAGGYGLSRIGSSPTSSQAASSGVASAASSAQAVPAAGVPSSAPASHHAVVPAVESPLVIEVVTSENDYQRANLQQKLALEVQRYAQGAAGTRELASAPVRTCVQLVTRGVSPGTLRLVETARFQGQPAIVIVAVSGHRDVAWVTTSACSGGSHYVLDMTTLPGTSAA